MSDSSNPNIAIICRQTTYTETEATQKLEKFNNDVMSVIKDYLGAKEKPKQTTSVNQQIYQELRTFMNGVNEQYEKIQEAKELANKN